MVIDPSKFHLVNVADTCAVWNLLSSKLLLGVAKSAGCDFCITSFVRYECLVKPRKSISPNEQALMDHLRSEQTRGAFQHHSCDISDLQAIKVLEERKRLGKGELSSIAFAMKIHQAVLTDDKKARKLSEDSGHRLTQTIFLAPVAWLVMSVAYFGKVLPFIGRRYSLTNRRVMSGAPSHCGWVAMTICVA